MNLHYPSRGDELSASCTDNDFDERIDGNPDDIPGDSQVVIIRCKAQFLVLLSLMLIDGCSREASTTTPRATKIPTEYKLPSLTWVDQYAYMANPDDPDTRQYIQEEEQYFAEQTAPWDSGIRQMMSELNAQLATSKTTDPLVTGAYEYYSNIHEGQQYPIFYRRLTHSGSEWQVVIDMNELSAGSDYFSLGAFSTSPDELTVAFTEDRSGRGLYRLRLRNLETGALSTVADGVRSSVAWLGSSVIAVSADTQSVIKYDPNGGKTTLYRENDPAFSLTVRNARDKRKVLVTAESHQATEVRVLSTDGQVHLVAPRMAGHRYRLILDEDQMTVLSNFRREDYEIASISLGQVDPAQWSYLSLGSPGSLKDFERIDDYLLVHLRNALTDELVLVNLDTGFEETIQQSGPGESFRLMRADDDGAVTFGFRRMSLLHPERRYELDALSHAVVEVGEAPAPANYQEDEYRVEERWVAVRDGTLVPATILYKSGEPLDKRPMYLTAYGAYGRSLPRAFDPTRLPLLKRGFIIGIVHVRGGGDLGTQWHSAGRHLNKQNTFTDLVDVTRGLVDTGVGDHHLLAARGASAGGTAIGVVANESPGLFKVLVANVPFVDVMTTLLDPGLPLTASDILEWGNPNISTDARYLFGFSPYHQVRTQSYPWMLIQVSENDGKVGLHEALKWMASIREHSLGESMQLIDIDENSGHLGASDQYERRHKQALEYVFLIHGLGLEI